MIRSLVRREVWWIAALFLLAVGCILLVDAWPAQMVLDVGEQKAGVYLQGFYLPEQSGGISFRWTRARAQVRFPGVGRDRQLSIQIEAVGPPVGGDDPAVVVISLDGQTLGSFRARPAWQDATPFDVYSLLVPAHSSANGNLALQLEIPPSFVGGKDTRPLGLAIRRVTVNYVGGLGWPSPLLSLALLAAPFVLYGIVRLAGWGKEPALALGAGLLFVLTVLLIRSRLWVAPYLPLVVAAMMILAVLLAFARFVAGKGASLPRVFVALAALAPLPLLWRNLLILDPGCQPVEMATLWDSLLHFPVRFLLPPLGPRDWLPIRATLLAGGLYLGIVLWQRWKKQESWPRAETIFAFLIVGFFVAYLALYLREKGLVDSVATDFSALFVGARRFFTQGGPLYDLEAIRSNSFGDVFKYPPFFALVLFPLVRVPTLAALQLWQELGLVSIVVAAVLLARLYRFERSQWLWGGLAFLLLAWRPIWDSIGYGQVDPLLFLLLVGVLYALKRGHGEVAGLLLALCTMLKLYPAFLVLFLLLRREWRALGAFAVGLVALNGLSVLLLGWPVHATYLREVLPISGGGTAWIENQTLNGFLNRLVTDRLALSPVTNARADKIALAAGAAFTLASAWFVYRHGKKDTPGYDLGFSLLATTMLLVLPAAWVHYQVLLLLPFVQLLVLARDKGAIPYRVLAVLAVSFGLLCLGNAWLFYAQEVFGRFWQLILSYKLYGLVVLWIGLALAMVFWSDGRLRKLLFGRLDGVCFSS